MNTANENFYQRLNRIFRSGPALRRKIKNQNLNQELTNAQSIHQTGQSFYGGKGGTPFNMLGAYAAIDREVRYREYAEMEYEGAISTALDLFADESCSGDENGRCFHVFSDNTDIQRALEELFYDVCNVDFELRRWIRNLVKYGDTFLHVEVMPDVGVSLVETIKITDIERQEGYDPEDPYAVRFKLTTGGAGKYLENWQVLHFRVVSNDIFIPYGTSFLESSRKIWRQLVMLEDAMLVYRLVRSPERRVFYIDVSGIHPNDVPNYMEQAKQAIRTNTSIDRLTGRSDERHNPIDVLEDYFLPTRPNSATKIDSLAGGQHVSAIEDVEYIQKKLTAALKVPRAYLGYEDGLSSKATLSQEDIRFSRTITNLQKIIIAELNQLAVLHLYAKGFDGEDLQDFELKLSNPSTIALQQKLNIWTLRFENAAKAKDSELVDEEWIQKEILGFRMDTINKIRLGREKDALRKKTLEALEPPKNENGEDTSSSLVDVFDASNYQIPNTKNKSPAVATPPASPNNPQIAPRPAPIPSEESQQIKSADSIGSKLPISPNMSPSRNITNKKRDGSTFNLVDFRKMLDMNLEEDGFLKRESYRDGRVKKTGIPESLGRNLISKLQRFEKSQKNNKMLLDIEILHEHQEPDDELVLLDLLKDAMHEGTI